MKEIWKDIADYEGYYQVSNLGNVRSCDRKIYSKNGNPLTPYTIRKSQIIRPNTSGLYNQVGLHKDGHMKNCTVHRLVAETFIENPRSVRYVNHIDGNKKNNHVDNLEWVTHSENKKHAFKIGLQKPLRGSKSPSSKVVLQYDLDGNLIKRWVCMKEAARSIGCLYQEISRVCRHERKTGQGFVWRYEDE